jgi:hypothetical protein
MALLGQIALILRVPLRPKSEHNPAQPPVKNTKQSKKTGLSREPQIGLVRRTQDEDSPTRSPQYPPTAQPTRLAPKTVQTKTSAHLL